MHIDVQWLNVLTEALGDERLECFVFGLYIVIAYGGCTEWPPVTRELDLIILWVTFTAMNCETFWSASFSPPWTLRNQAKDGLYGAHAWYPKYSWRCWRVKQWLCSQDQRADEILTGKASCRTGGRPRKLLFSILRKIPFTKPAQSFWKEFTSKYSWLLLYGEKCIQGRINAYKQILVTRTFQSFWAVCLCLHWLNI